MSNETSEGTKPPEQKKDRKENTVKTDSYPADKPSIGAPQVSVETQKEEPKDLYPKPEEKFQLRVQASLADSEKQKDEYPKPNKKFQQSLKETAEKSEDNG